VTGVEESAPLSTPVPAGKTVTEEEETAPLSTSISAEETVRLFCADNWLHHHEYAVFEGLGIVEGRTNLVFGIWDLGLRV